MVGWGWGDSLQRFHFSNGIFLGQWYPEGFHAKSMVLKRFTRNFFRSLSYVGAAMGVLGAHSGRGRRSMKFGI